MVRFLWIKTWVGGRKRFPCYFIMEPTNSYDVAEINQQHVKIREYLQDSKSMALYRKPPKTGSHTTGLQRRECIAMCWNANIWLSLSSFDTWLSTLSSGDVRDDVSKVCYYGYGRAGKHWLLEEIVISSYWKLKLKKFFKHFCIKKYDFKKSLWRHWGFLFYSKYCLKRSKHSIF